MNEQNQERLIELLDAFNVAGDMTIETRDYMKLIRDLLRGDKTPEEIFEYYFGSIDELNKNLDECGYEGV